MYGTLCHLSSVLDHIISGIYIFLFRQIYYKFSILIFILLLFSILIFYSYIYLGHILGMMTHRYQVSAHTLPRMIFLFFCLDFINTFDTNKIKLLNKFANHIVGKSDIKKEDKND